MEFERLQNVQNGVRYFDTATSSTSFYQWTEGGATYFSVMGRDITQYALKINPDDTISFGSGGSFVTIGTEQTITAKKTFTGGLKLTNLPGYVAYPYRYTDVLRLGAGGEVQTTTIDLTDSVTLSDTQTITGGKTFSSADMFFTGLLTTLTTGYTGNLMAIDSSGRPSKVSAASLPYVTLGTTQTIPAGKTFSSAEMYFSGLEAESTPTTGGFAIIRGNKLRYCAWNTVASALGGGGNYVTTNTVQNVTGKKTFSEVTINKLYTAGELVYPSYFLTIDGTGAIYWSYTPVTLNTTQTITAGKTFSSAEMYFNGLEAESTPVTGGFAIIRGNKLRYCAWNTVAGLIGGGVGGNFVTTDTYQSIPASKLFTALVSFNGSVTLGSTSDLHWGTSGNTGRLWKDGDLQSTFAYNNPTSSPSNTHITSGGLFRRSTASSSTIRIKKDVEDIIPKNYNLIHSLRPIWHRYSIKLDTPEEWGWYGLIAEEVAELIPQLVIYDYDPEDYEEDKGTKEGKKLRSGAIRKPVGVRYDRLAVLMLPELQNLRKENDDLRKRVEDLEAIVTKISTMIQ